MFLGIVFDNHRSNKLDKPTQLLFLFFPFRADSVHHLLLHLFNGWHLLVQSGCTCFNYITHISNWKSVLFFIYIYIFEVFISWRASMYFWRVKVITVCLSFDIFIKRRTLCLKLISLFYPRIKATFYPQIVTVVCLIHHSVSRFWVKTLKSAF